MDKDSRGTEYLTRIRAEQKFESFYKLVTKIFGEMNIRKPEDALIMLWLSIERICEAIKKNKMINDDGEKVDVDLIMKVAEAHYHEVKEKIDTKVEVKPEDIGYVG